MGSAGSTPLQCCSDVRSPTSHPSAAFKQEALALSKIDKAQGGKIRKSSNQAESSKVKLSKVKIQN